MVCADAEPTIITAREEKTKRNRRIGQSYGYGLVWQSLANAINHAAQLLQMERATEQAKPPFATLPTTAIQGKGSAQIIGRFVSGIIELLLGGLSLLLQIFGRVHSRSFNLFSLAFELMTLVIGEFTVGRL